MEQDNDIRHFIGAMGLQELPAIFTENWESAMERFPGMDIAFLTGDFLQRANRVLFLSDEKLAYFYNAIGAIRSDINLCRFVWLWHYCLFVVQPFPKFAEILSWPFPERQMGAFGQFFHGVVLLSGLDWLTTFYQSRGIPLKVLTDTLSEFDICLDEHKAKYGQYGIGLWRTRWLLYHFTGRVFRLGRLEFIFSEFSADYSVYQNTADGHAVSIYENEVQRDPAIICGRELLCSGYPAAEESALKAGDWKLVLKKGDGVLQVHITIQERLPLEASVRSLAMAVDFYEKHFPELHYKLFTCDSWLMDPQLPGLLPPTSNVVKFQKLFRLYPEPFEENDVYRFAFDIYQKPEDLSTLPQGSSLHKALRAHLMKGNFILAPGGFIPKEVCREYQKDAYCYEETYLRCCGEGGSMTSRQRVLAAIKRQPVDYVPCSPLYNTLYPEQRVGHEYQFPWGPSELEMADYNVKKLGLDPVISVEVTGYERDAGVTSRIWLENGILHKRYETPSGSMHAAVWYNQLWPHGMDIPFFSDFNVGHYVEPWIETIGDVECLKHILVPAKSKEYHDRLIFNSNRGKAIAGQYGLATMCSVGMGLTGAMLLFGVDRLCVASIENPELVDSYLEFEHELNLSFIGVAAELGVDIMLRNGFYETCDFYSPKALKYFLGSRLQEEFALAHRHGIATGYVLNTGIMPMLENLAELDFDCVVKMDIAFKDLDLQEVQRRLGDKKSFWVGPSSVYHIAQGTGSDVRAAVRKVYDAFGKQGLLLTACPTSHSIMPWSNTLAMVEEWRRLRIYP